MKGLDNVINAAGCKAAELVGGVVERGNEDNRDVAGGFLLLQQPAELQPVHLRHEDIEQDQVRPFFPHQKQGLLAVQGSANLVALLFQEALEDALVDLGILDNQD